MLHTTCIKQLPEFVPSVNSIRLFYCYSLRFRNTDLFRAHLWCSDSKWKNLMKKFHFSFESKSIFSSIFRNFSELASRFSIETSISTKNSKIFILCASPCYSSCFEVIWYLHVCLWWSYFRNCTRSHLKCWNY